MNRPHALLFALWIGCLPAARAQTPELFSNGNLEASRDAAQPDDWGLGKTPGATWETEGGNHFLRLKSPEPGAQVLVYRAVTLPQNAGALELRFRERHDAIKRGKQAWFDGRIMLNFKDAKKQGVAPSPPHPNFSGTSALWKDHMERFKVPAGATTLELLFTLFQPESGQLDLDDITLKAVPLEEIEAVESAARAKESARIAALPRPVAKVPVATAAQLPKALHVAGNELRDSANAPVCLQGVAIPSLEWSAGGEHILESIQKAIEDWKANCIRLCIRDNFWAGTGPYQKDGGLNYRQLVEDAVNACASRGVYIVLDLHDYRAPQTKHAVFWKAVAEHYKNHPAVLFELLNEPHDISWEVWKNGGPVLDQKKGDPAVANENREPLVSFVSIGMQSLVETIRQTGAQNVLIAGGLDWGYDLSGVLRGFALEDKAGGHGIVYSSHVYPWKSDWQGKFLDAAEKFPLFVGEVGADANPMEFIPAERQEAPATWVPDMLGVIQKKQLNWTAWCFHPKSTPRLLLDWNYTPTPFWGQPVREALAGKPFPMGKLR